MGSNEQDFNNQAFVPYAINGDETTYVPNGKYDCKDDGYVKPFINVDPNKNHEYENPSDVAKRAGLNRAGSGPRRKKNQLYGDTKKQQRVRLPDTPSSPTDGAESSPLVVTTLPEVQKSQSRKCDIKMIIFFILLLCLSAGGLALSLMNMMNKDDCLCSRKGTRLYNFNEIDLLCTSCPMRLCLTSIRAALFVHAKLKFNIKCAAVIIMPWKSLETCQWEFDLTGNSVLDYVNKF